MTMAPVPENERSPLLEPVLRECVEMSRLLFRNQNQLGLLPNDIFANALRQWFLGDNLSEEENRDVAERKKQLIAVGFDGDHLKQQLEVLFASDSHLASCCKTVWMLTKCLSSLFLNHMISDTSDERFATAFSAFSEYIYCEPYRVFALHHLYNFDADIDEFQLDGTVFTRFSQRDVIFVLESEIVFNLFHAEGVGEFYAYREILGDEKDQEEFFKHLNLNYEIVTESIGLLQFVKDGLVYSDFNFLNYKPSWVNKLFPPHPVGNPRRLLYDDGRSFYRLAEDDVTKVATWLRIWRSNESQKQLEEQSNLGSLIRLAIELYSSSFYQLDEAQRLLHLTFALEALFSPSDNQELSFRIRQYASQFVGETADERQQIYNTVKRAYGDRSKLVHGSLDVSSYINDTLTTATDNTALASVVRRSLLGMLALLFSGRRNLKDHNKEKCIHRELELGSLDTELAEKLRKESNAEDFVRNFVQ